MQLYHKSQLENHILILIDITLIISDAFGKFHRTSLDALKTERGWQLYICISCRLFFNSCSINFATFIYTHTHTIVCRVPLKVTWIKDKESVFSHDKDKLRAKFAFCRK